MVDACTAVGALPFYGPYGDIKDVEGCETQFRAAFLLGCVGAWSLHPVQIEIAKKVFSPDPDEVAFAKKVIEAIPDGRGVHMIDGKMQDDATWKQCRVMVDLAEMLARKDPELAEAYGMAADRRRRMRFFEYEAREIVKRAGIPVTDYGFTTDAAEARGDRRAHRRPDRHQVPGPDRRAHEGRRREVRRHARRGRGARPPTSWRWRSTATCRAACSSTRRPRSSRSSTPASSGTGSASSR